MIKKPRKLVSTFKIMQPEFHFYLVFDREFQEEEMNDIPCTGYYIRRLLQTNKRVFISRDLYKILKL